MKRCLLIGLLFSWQFIAAQTVVYDANIDVRDVKNFNAIEVSGAIDLFISQGKEEAVAVSATNIEVRDRIKTEVKNGTLHIYFDSKGWNWKTWGNNKTKAYVTFTNLNRLEASGACNIKPTEAIKVKDLKIELSGASDFSGTINVSNLVIDASGASNLNIAGTAEKTDIDISGACNVKAYDFKVDFCIVDASGASNLRITVNKELKAQASGGSSIYYRGEGIIRSIDTSGGATVKKKTDN